MKYVLKNTSYRGDSETVEEMYLAEDLWAWQHTVKLSGAHVWNTFDEIADFIENEDANDHKVVHIKEEDLFQARLKGT